MSSRHCCCSGRSERSPPSFARVTEVSAALRNRAIAAPWRRSANSVQHIIRFGEVEVIVLINVFTVDPTNQQRLVDILTKATDVSVRQAKGFISATLHPTIGGTRDTI